MTALFAKCRRTSAQCVGQRVQAHPAELKWLPVIALKSYDGASWTISLFSGMQRNLVRHSHATHSVGDVLLLKICRGHAIPLVEAKAEQGDPEVPSATLSAASAAQEYFTALRSIFREALLCKIVEVLSLLPRPVALNMWFVE